MQDIPIGAKLIEVIVKKCGCNISNRTVWYKVSVFVLTFITYTCYHASRKPLSIVKSEFNKSCSGLIPPPDIVIDDSNRDTWCDWAPFYGPHASSLLATLDFAFLFAYAIAMFVSGFIGERMSLRYFLAIGMITSGISCYMFGIARHYKIHSLSYFVAAQIFGGIVQTTGWPGVVTVMANWFGKDKKGVIFGIWNAHTSLGNILGTEIAARFLNINWGLSFIVPGMLIAVAGFINFLFLVESPSKAGLETPNIPQPSNAIKRMGDQSQLDDSQSDSAGSDTELLVDQRESLQNYAEQDERAIGFMGALKIPGVVEFSLCLFFAKLVSYTLLYWLPLYILDSTNLSASGSSDLSTAFDFGAMIGGILAGAVVDYTGLNAITCAVMLFLSIPLLSIYYIYGATNWIMSVTLLTLVGFFVNGPYALITTAVSAELGTHESLASNSKALATVSAIIDGTGSIGAAVGPLIAGLVYNYGWKNVFYILTASDILALLMLMRLVKNECQQLRQRH